MASREVDMFEEWVPLTWMSVRWKASLAKNNIHLYLSDAYHVSDPVGGTLLVYM